MRGYFDLVLRQTDVEPDVDVDDGDDDELEETQRKEIREVLVHSTPMKVVYGALIVLSITIAIMGFVLYKHGRTQQRLAYLASCGGARVRRGRYYGGHDGDVTLPSHSQLDVCSESLSDDVFESTKSTCSSVLLHDEAAAAGAHAGAHDELFTVKM